MRTLFKSNGSLAKPDFTWINSQRTKYLNRLTYNMKQVVKSRKERIK